MTKQPDADEGAIRPVDEPLEDDYAPEDEPLADDDEDDDCPEGA